MRVIQSTIYLFLTTLSLYAQTEKVDLVTNQNLYLTGESVFFGAICEHDNKPTTLSKIIYVELIDENGQSRIQEIFPLDKGILNGSIFLPSSLKTGNYVLIAYTRWMKNASLDHFGKKMIGVINPFEEISSEIFSRMDSVSNQNVSKETAINIELVKKKINTDDSLYFEVPDYDLSTKNLFLSIEKLDERSNHEQSNTFSYSKEYELNEYTVPEPFGFLLEGKIQDENGRPLSTTISLTNTDQNNSVFFSNSDASGNFRFLIEENQRIGSITLKTADYSTIEIKSPFIGSSINWDIPSIKINSSLKPWILKRAQEVQIEDAFFAEKYEVLINDNAPALFNYLEGKTYFLDDYTRFPKLEDPIVEYIPEIRIRSKNGQKILSAQSLNYIGESDSTLVLLNGIPLTSQELFAVNPNYVKSISAYPHYVIINGFEFAGVIDFRTYPKYQKNIRLENTKKINYSNTKYKINQDHRLADFRNQLLWQSIQGNQKMKFWFSASMSKGAYLIKVMDSKENLVSSSTFQIE